MLEWDCITYKRIKSFNIYSASMIFATFLLNCEASLKVQQCQSNMSLPQDSSK